MASLPGRPSDVTAEWIEDVMRRSGSLPKGSVTRVRADENQLESGFFGDVARLHVDYEEAPAAAPATMIAKFPSSDQGAVAIGKERGYYEREVIFYRDFASSCGMRVPACFGAEFDPDGGGNVLLLEDLSSFRAGSSQSESWLEDTRAMMEQLGGFHASWWQRGEEISQLAWLAASDAGADRFQAAFAKAWPIAVEWIGSDETPAALEPGFAVVERVAEIKRHLAKPPFVFLHADLRSENLFFIDGAESEVVVLDWQHCRRGRAPADVASYLFGAGHRLRPDDEEALVADYYRSLSAGGVTGYSWDECLRDYRLAMVDRFVNVGSTFAAVDPATENGQKAVRYLSECTMSTFLRHARVLEDL